MCSAMRHEAFYASGQLLEDRLGTAVGWVCHEGSFGDCLPIWNETRDVCLVFAGEHFAEHDDVARLEAAGHHLAGVRAEHLVHQYEVEGECFFERLNGIFSGVVLDLREKQIVLFNDRYGLGRVYYHECLEGFFFASEAKSLLRVLPQLRKLDLQGLGEYLSCGCVLQDRTLFSGVFLLPPGSAWTFQASRPPRKERYFDREAWERQEPLPEAEYYARLRETFGRILPKYFLGDRKVALSLTGGLDSRMILAAVQAKPQELPCYTVRGMYRECADAAAGRRIAAICGQPHQVITVGRDFFAEFPELARRTVYCTDGAMDAVGAAGLYANRMARSVAPVRMTGNYGGEVLRGIVGFKPGFLSEWLFDEDFLPYYRLAAVTFARERVGLRISFILFKQMPWHHYARFAMESTQLTVRSPFLDNELVRLAYQAPADPATNKALAHRLIEDANPALAGVPTDRGRAQCPSFVPAGLWEWWKELMPRMEYLYDYGMPDWLLRVDRTLGFLHLQRLFLGQQKYCHFRTWYGHELGSFVREILLDPRTLSRPYWNGGVVKERVTAHVNGTGNCTVEIHKLLAVEFIHRALLE